MTANQPIPIATYNHQGLMSARDHQALRKSPKVVAFQFTRTGAGSDYMEFPGSFKMSAGVGYKIRRKMRVVEGIFAKGDTMDDAVFEIRVDGEIQGSHTLSEDKQADTATFSVALPAGSVLSMFVGPKPNKGSYAVLWAMMDVHESDMYVQR